MKKESSQSLLLVLVVITIFTGAVVTVASLTSRELRLREIEESALKTNYAAQSGIERAKMELAGLTEVPYAGNYALSFNGTNTYIEVPAVDNPLQDGNAGTIDQFTIEGRFKIDNINSIQDGLNIIYARRDETTNQLIEGSVALAGAQATGGWACYPGTCYPYHLYTRAYVQDLVNPQGYYWVTAADSSGTGWSFNPTQYSETNPNGDIGAWQYFAISLVAAPLPPTYYFWQGNENMTDSPATQAHSDMWIQTSQQDISRVGHDVKVYVGGVPSGKLALYEKYFGGLIDEVRFYVHPRYCGLSPTFWTDPPSDPKNHSEGNYGYTPNKPCCAQGVCTCGWSCSNQGCGSFWTSSCGATWTGYYTYFSYPSDYSMEKNDLKIYQKFNEGQSCIPGTACLIDDSVNPKKEDGTLVGGFDSSSWIKTDPYIPITVSYSKVLDVSLKNSYKYSYYIIPKNKDEENADCACPDTTETCCCETYYCIRAFGTPPQ